MPTIVVKRRLTAHQYALTWFEDPEKNHVAYMDLRQLTVYEHFAWVNMWNKVHHVAWKSFVRIFPLALKL